MRRKKRCIYLKNWVYIKIEAIFYVNFLYILKIKFNIIGKSYLYLFFRLSGQNDPFGN